MSSVMILQADARKLPLADKSVDLVFCSPPYEAARTYGIGFNLRGQEWVDWAVECVVEALRVCRGLVAWNCEGQVKNHQWSATPALLMADLHRRGIVLRKPPIYKRHGTFGGGGRASQHSNNGGSADWLCNKYEFVVCATNKADKLPWADALATGHKPKFKAGGSPSNRLVNGARVTRSTERMKDGSLKKRTYVPPEKANPGNVIDCGVVGGKHMGSDLACENEAPFPVKLAEFFVRSFCPPEGIVLDTFSGSGTTAHAAIAWGRNAIACDIRDSQCVLTRKRVAEVQTNLYL